MIGNLSLNGGGKSPDCISKVAPVKIEGAALVSPREAPRGMFERLRSLFRCLRYPCAERELFSLQSLASGMPRSHSIGNGIVNDQSTLDDFLSDNIKDGVSLCEVAKSLRTYPQLVRDLRCDRGGFAVAAPSGTVTPQVIVNHLFSKKAFDLLVCCADQLDTEQCVRLTSRLRHRIGWRYGAHSPVYYRHLGFPAGELEHLYCQLMDKLETLKLPAHEKKTSVAFLAHHAFALAVPLMLSDLLSRQERFTLCDFLLSSGAPAARIAIHLVAFDFEPAQFRSLAKAMMAAKQYRAVAQMMDCFTYDARKSLVKDLLADVPPVKMLQALEALYEFFNLTPTDTFNILKDRFDALPTTHVPSLIIGLLSSSNNASLLDQQGLQLAEEFSQAIMPEFEDLTEKQCVALANIFKKVLKFSLATIFQYRVDLGKLASKGELGPFLNFSNAMGPNVAPQSIALWGVLEKPVSSSTIQTLKPVFSNQGTKDVGRKASLTDLVKEVKKLCSRTRRDARPLSPQSVLLRVCQESEGETGRAGKTKAALVILEQIQILNILLQYSVLDLKNVGTLFRDPGGSLLGNLRHTVYRGVMAAAGMRATAAHCAQLKSALAPARKPGALLNYVVRHYRSERAVRQANRKLLELLMQTRGTENAFHHYRYNPKHNRNWRRVLRAAPMMAKQWSTREAPECFGDYMANVAASDGFSLADEVRQLLRQRVLVYRHWQACERLLTQLNDPERSKGAHLAGAPASELYQKRNTSDSLLYTASGQLEQALIALLSMTSQKALSEKMVEIKRLASVANIPREFMFDLEELDQLITFQNKLPAPAHISLTDDFDDLLLSGTEIMGSCQRVDSAPIFNKGLQAYILDGKIKLLAVKNAHTGIISARRVARLLLDNRGQPVLHLDRLYANPGYGSPVVDRAMQAYAAKLARNWGVPLLLADQDVPLVGRGSDGRRSDVAYPLQSYGGPAEWEYVDAASGLMQRGVYSLP